MQYPSSAMALKFLLALFSIALSLVVGELAARAIWGAPAWTDKRVVFFSSKTWKRDPTGALRYAPDAQLRAVSIFGNQVEFDVRFRTNNLGFIDPVNYAPDASKRGKEGVVFVGDSLTAGYHGGAPWVPRLRDQAQKLRPEIEIYNLGVGAVGVINFTRLAKSVETELDFQKIVFLMITEDIYRNQWRPFERDGTLYLCPEAKTKKTCRSEPSRMLVLNDNDLGVDQMQAIMKEKGVIQPARGVLEWWMRESFIGARLRPLIIGETPNTRAKPSQGMMERLFADWLEAVKTEFGPKEIVVVHLPTKADVYAGHFALDAASRAQSAGIEYISLLEECDLEFDDYFAIDGHPNSRGYQKILQCVGSALDLI
jgi:hypothetical protein